MKVGMRIARGGGMGYLVIDVLLYRLTHYVCKSPSHLTNLNFDYV